MASNHSSYAECSRSSCLSSNAKGENQKLGCCDESCLDEIARRDCSTQCNQDYRTVECHGGSRTPESNCSPYKLDDTPTRPCEEHSRSARERYGSTLEALGCICRALLARNMESCCSSKPQSQRNSRPSTPITRKKNHKGSNFATAGGCISNSDACCGSNQNKGPGRKSGDIQCGSEPGVCTTESCCKSNQAHGLETGRSNTAIMELGENSSDSHCISKAEVCLPESCCKSDQAGCSDTVPRNAKIVKRGRGSSDSHRISKAKECMTESCCKNDQVTVFPPNAAVTEPEQFDIEKGITAAERVVLSVEGMTCVGCENKLFRSLNSIPAAHNLKTSLVLSRAEFDLDLRAASVDEVMASIQRTTGFSCERLASKGQHIDVIPIGTAAEFTSQTYPTGVYDMTALDKHVVRVTYDPAVIGARCLLEDIFSTEVRLAPLRLPPADEVGNNHVRKTAYMTLLSAILTIPVLVLAWAPLPEHDITYGAISLALATVVQFVVAGPFYPSAIRSLVFTRVIEMDLLIVLSTSTAYVFSLVAFACLVRDKPLSTKGFFETSTLLVTLIMLGRYISALARQKAVESISIRSLQIQTARLVVSEGRETTEIDARLLQYGDVFMVPPESRIVTDGKVISGMTEVDESMVTGEAKLVGKHPGSSVVAGSINGLGGLVVRLTNLPGDNTISQIANMVDEAKFSKPRTQEIADRVAGYFVPVVLAVTLITFGVWIAVGKAVRNAPTASTMVEAVTYAVSVLIVSCPCAIGLAVPMVIVISGGVAAKFGVVFKSATTIDIARKVEHVVFDKTGTLTQGQLSVIAEEYVSGSKDTTLSLILGLTSNIRHPVSSAVVKYLQGLGVKPVTLENVTTVTGSGIEGVFNGANIRAGNSRWLGVEDLPQVQSLLARGLTVFCVCDGDQLLMAFGLEDSLRPDACSVVAELIRRGIAVSIVSGDDSRAVESIAAKIGVSHNCVRSGYGPRQKQRYVEDVMKSEGKVVLFCGDGTNDAVALTQASIGVHMNEGTDVAQSAADVVLIRPNLSGILVLIDLSKAAYRRIIFNFAWSFVYNTLAVLLAAGAFVKARIPPQYAGLGEIVSVLPVILIALQLRWFKAK